MMNDDFVYFDISKLKPNGYHYVAIKFSLPYCLHLQNESYDVALDIELETQKGILETQILLEDRFRNQERRKDFPFSDENTFIEKAKDTQGIFRYTSVQVFIPIGSNNPEKPTDFDSIWEHITQSKIWFRNQAIESVNRLLNTYRYYSKEFHIKPLAGRELWFDFIFALLYNENPPDAKTSDFTIKYMPIMYWHDIYPQIENVSESIVSKIRKHLISTQNISLGESLLLNAYAYHDQGDYRLAIIEVETAFEATIHQHLQEFFKEDQTTFNKIEEIDKFTNLVKCKLCRPAFKGKEFSENIPEFVLWRKNVMDLRNSIVHGDKITVSEKEAHEAINIIENTLAFLIQRPSTFSIQDRLKREEKR
ncbi:MAG: hypothetical protein R6X34_04035 [Chloroflexota bacterium]